MQLTVGATEDCVLLRVDRLTASSLLTKYQQHHISHPQLAALAALTLAPPGTRTASALAVTAELLPAVPLLAPLPPSVLHQCAAALHYTVLLPGESVLLTEQPGALWIVLDGTVHLTARRSATDVRPSPPTTAPPEGAG